MQFHSHVNICGKSMLDSKISVFNRTKYAHSNLIRGGNKTLFFGKECIKYFWHHCLIRTETCHSWGAQLGNWFLQLAGDSSIWDIKPQICHGRSMLHFEKVCITCIDYWLKRAFDLLALVKWPISKLYRCSQTLGQHQTNKPDLDWNFSPYYFVISVQWILVMKLQNKYH